MPWKPSVPGERPTLGFYVIDWIAENLAAPARDEYEPFVLYREQEDFVLKWYELDPKTGRFLCDRGLLGRPRGWGKSPLLGALAAVESLADVVPDGWDADGRPVGKPWSRVKTPLTQISAVSEEQTRNTWQPLLEMLRLGPVMDNYPGVEPWNSQIILPRGRIEQVTSSSGTIKGAPGTFAVLDQTEEWKLPNHKRLANTIRTNTAKNGGRTLESPNAFIPGEGSVAEDSAAYADAVTEGRVKRSGLLYDHREAPADTDLSDHDSLIKGMRVSYGDSSGHPGGCVIHDPPCPPGHQDLEALVSRIWDPASDPQVSRSDFLNQVTHASDSWVSRPEWQACLDIDKVIGPREPIVLGFDGSKGRVRGNSDATALVGCRVSDGHMFEVRVWEAPSGPQGKEWLPPALEVDAEVRTAFQRWNVIGLYADPSGWAPQVAAWEAEFGRKLKIKINQQQPMTVWPRGKDSRVIEMVDRLRQSIVLREMTHDGSSSLTRHVLNARRRMTKGGYLIYKKFPESPDKIDAAYAAVMAWKARLDAVSRGVKAPQGSGRRVLTW